MNKNKYKIKTPAPARLSKENDVNSGDEESKTAPIIKK
jgi:hypothetical protein